jgi:hypothetical protein
MDDGWMDDGWTDAMARGDFARGWEISDRNLRENLASRRYDIPRHVQNIWTGAPLAGRRVLVRCYHGLGDTLQFVRFLPWVERLARETVLWVQPALIPLLQRSFDGVRLLPLHDGAPDAAYDVDVEIMELPHVFRTTVDTVPADVPYLRVAAPERRDRAFQVGVMWRAGSWDADRHLPFALVKELLGVPGVRGLPLTERLEPDEAAPFGGRALCATVETLAARIASCDLVLTVDTMAAHLAGALAVPTWTLLKHDADWRWMRDRTDSPWYPTMRLFRQPAPGEWAMVVDRVRAELAAVASR